jgi:hypothetical protein
MQQPGEKGEGSAGLKPHIAPIAWVSHGVVTNARFHSLGAFLGPPLHLLSTHTLRSV